MSAAARKGISVISGRKDKSHDYISGEKKADETFPQTLQEACG